MKSQDWKFSKSSHYIRCENCKEKVNQYWYSDQGEVHCDLCQRELHPYMFWGERKKENSNQIEMFDA